jgi:hypothetical protein
VKEHILEIKKLIPSSICKKIIQYYDYGFEEAALSSDKPGGEIVKNFRNCYTKSIQTSTTFGEEIMLKYIKSRIFLVLEKYGKKFPHLYIEGISQLDMLKYEANKYDAGYKYHIDFGPKSMNRHLSLSICLNNDFKGGEFQFDLQDGQMQYPQNEGDCLCFPSNFMFPHQVNKVISGTRYALICWAV